jgi:curved DNA-binding protein CbpA
MTEFVDYYKVLDLDHWATTDEIKAKHRKLRADYFTSAPKKYRTLQAAYAVLVDQEARLQYDTVYRRRMGVPEPPSLKTITTTTASSEVPSITTTSSPPPLHTRQDSGVARVSLVKGMVEELEKEMKPVEEEIKPVDKVAIVPDKSRTDDPNWALKHPNHVYEPLTGTRLYHSFVPISLAYEGGRGMGPKYVGVIAVNARPL